MLANQVSLAALFTEARTQNGWQKKPVSDSQLRQMYELMKWGPTSANCSPARLIFVRGHEAKERLLTCMIPGNLEKTREAPVVAIIGMDMAFYEKLPALFPHTDARSWFVGNQELIEATAFRNSSLQGAYLMLAARALGLDCGPMSGFDPQKLNDSFFAGTTTQVNFVCGLGYGDPSKVFPRSPRLAFDDTCSIL